MIRILLLLIIPLAAVSCAPGRSLHDSAPRRSEPLQSEAAVRKAAVKFMESIPYGALSLGVIKDGIPHTWNFGELERGTGRMPTQDTRYPIASVTKTFAATLLAQAVVEKKLTLDDDIRIHLREPYPNLEFNGEPIRLHQLLNHNSGLPMSLSESNAERSPEKNLGQTGFYEALHRVKIENIPGTRFRYSNVAAQLLGYILEDLYGMPFERLVDLKIGRPLGMKNTGVSMTSTERVGLKGYGEADVIVLDDTEHLQAAGGLKSTVSDLLKYLQWHLAEKDQAVRLTHQPRWKLTDTYSIGLNWQMFSFPNYRYIWQEGSVPGFNSYSVICPELNLAVAALVNKLDRSSSDRLSAMVKQIVRDLDARAATLP